MPLKQRLAAEFIGTMALSTGVIGSGIMAERLAGGNLAVALLANAAATAALLYVLICVLAPISGAHFNPAVTLALHFRGEMLRRTAASYMATQTSAAICGVILAHAMFGLAAISPSTHTRGGLGQWISEGLATGGLISTIVLGARFRPQAIPGLVASYIFAAYWFTASTAFANPALTLARALTDTFAGIQPADVAAFMLSQAIGAAMAVGIVKILTGNSSSE